MTDPSTSSSLTSIPKNLPPRTSADGDQLVPRILWQTMKQDRLPAVMARWMQTWIDGNPEYSYRFFDDDDVREFIATEFSDYLEAYDRLEFGASKADLWRYLILYRYGGVYVDVDCECIEPLRSWIDPKASFVTQLGTNQDVCQWMLISAPGNPILRLAAERARARILAGNTRVRYRGFGFEDGQIGLQPGHIEIRHAVKGLAGPPVLQEAAESCFEDPELASLFEATQVVCVSRKRSCQMGGRVAHHIRDEEYVAGLALMSAPHYSRRELLAARLRKLLRRVGLG
jgi:hypothetical protein